jgi:hypothetical protein
MTTVWQICGRGLKCIWLPYDKFHRGYWQLLQMAHICHRVLTPSEHLAEGIDYPLEHLAEGTG